MIFVLIFNKNILYICDMKHLLSREMFLSLAYDNESEYIVEGIDIDYHNRTVRLNPNHNKGINYSISDNPIEYNLYIHKVPISITSMFTRTSTKSKYDVDGNPFIKCLKDLDGWKFDISDSEIYEMFDNFVSLCSKIKKKYDTIIIVPSKYKINTEFANILQKHVKTDNVIVDFFRKKDKYYMLENLDRDGIRKDLCYIGNAYNDKIFEDIMNEIFDRVDYDMKIDKFEAKYVKKYLKYFNSYITVNEFTLEDVFDKIEDKNILILDDTISTGETVSYCVDALLTTFNPKNVDIITYYCH